MLKNSMKMRFSSEEKPFFLDSRLTFSRQKGGIVAKGRAQGRVHDSRGTDSAAGARKIGGFGPK